MLSTIPNFGRFHLLISLGLAGLITACGGGDGTPPADMGPPDEGVAQTANGTPCTMDEGCVGGTCFAGFERLGAEDFDGAFFPDGYCTMVGCTTDQECGEGAGCVMRSDGEGGTEGVCLMTCSSPTDCRSGYTCATAEGNADTRTFCVGEGLQDPCPDEAANYPTEWQTPGTCVVRYTIAGDGAQFQIAETSLGAGDATYDVGPGEIVVALTSDQQATAAPTTGAAELLCYRLQQNFVNRQGIVTFTQASAMKSTATAIATGTVETDGTLNADVLRWDTCTYAASYGDSITSWTPEDPASGAGCVDGYRSEGDVNCTAASFICSVGNLEVGHNIQDGTWDQPFNSFEFGVDYGTLTMAGLDGPVESGIADKVEIPNDSPSRTYLGFTATQTNVTCY